MLKRLGRSRIAKIYLLLDGIEAIISRKFKLLTREKYKIIIICS